MSLYHRAYSPAGRYFFTLVTYQRRAIFNSEGNIQFLRSAMQKVKKTKPFIIEAIVVLPDHLHCIWQLPENDQDYSGRWREIKKQVSKSISPISNHRRERPVWQRRFWEHLIRDEEDWRRHLDYIHYNPVKHGYVSAPKDWPWSSFAKAVERGWYDKGWGTMVPDTVKAMHFE